MDDVTRAQVVLELMSQASQYKALGKTAEALAIYERIAKRTDFSDKEAIAELAMLYNPEQSISLYKTVALHALARFDRKTFVEYCKLLDEEISFVVTNSRDGAIEVCCENEKITLGADNVMPQAEDSKGDNSSNYEENLYPVEEDKWLEDNKDDKSSKDDDVAFAQEIVIDSPKPKRKKQLPSMGEIADVLQSGGIEQALYMLDRLEEEDGEVKDLWYLRALCFVAKNDMSSAKYAIDKEMILYPNNSKAKRLAVDIGRVVGKKNI